MKNNFAIGAKPKFIAVEGIDGSGKSTVVKLIREFLFEEGIHSLATREPGGSDLGGKVREILLSSEDLDPQTQLLLVAASRRSHAEQLIKPAMNDENSKLWVVCDRFLFSTCAYQGAIGGVDPQHIKNVTDISIGDFRPDLVIYLDVTVENSKARKNADERTNNHLDRLSDSDYNKARNCFRALTQLADYAVEVDTNNRSIEEVMEDVKSHLRPLIEVEVQNESR